MKESIVIPKIKDDRDVIAYAAGLKVTIDAVQGDSLPASRDPFWDKCEELLLRLVCFYICRLSKYERTVANMKRCVEMLASESIDEDLPTIKALKGVPGSTQNECYKTFLFATGKSRKTVCVNELIKMGLLF